jgi:hypothetical protein
LRLRSGEQIPCFQTADVVTVLCSSYLKFK